MEVKIRQYVDYQFRFKDNQEVQELKEEIIANLIDRYYENLAKYNDENKAYVETIKQMGDFSEEIKTDNNHNIKPSLIETTFIIACVLSIFGLVLLFINMVMGTVFTAISISSYACGAYYLYSQAKYALNEKKDIEEHHVLLTKIVKYLKTNFIFWAINIAIILAYIISILLSSILISFYQIDIRLIPFYIVLQIWLFFVFILILLYVFYKTYIRIIENYQYMTGYQSPQSHFKDSVNFLGKNLLNSNNAIKINDINYKKIFLKVFNIKYISVINLLVVLFSFLRIDHYQQITLVSNNLVYDYTFKTAFELIIYSFEENNFIPILSGIMLAIFLILAITSIIGLISKRRIYKLQIILFYLYSIGFTLFSIIYQQANTQTISFYSINYNILLLIAIMIVTIILIVKGILNKPNKKLKTN